MTLKSLSIVRFAALCGALLFVSTPLTNCRADDAAVAETPAQHDARMNWWREARFGMFIHWGVYSVPAGTYQGKRVPGAGEWIMHNGKIPVAEYRKFAKRFNPVKYDPDAWVRLAKQAGMKYLVITSKHHDGFALFASKASKWNVVDATPYGKDLLKPLAAACHKYGIRLGFYYSEAQDWNNPGGAAIGGHWDKAQDGDFDEYLRTVAVPQVREILSNYGKVSILWWDTPKDMTPERAAMFLPLLKLQPGIITNNRLGGGAHGDFETPEQRIPATGLPGHDWETCMTMNNTWGYRSDDNHWKSAETLIRNLVDIASKGGNYLLNVGPTSEGLIPQSSVERLQTIGKWMKVNGQAIYDTTASPFRHLPWGRCTKNVLAKSAILYLHVFDWPSDGELLVPGLESKPLSAYLLADPQHRPLKTASGDAGVTVYVPKSAPDPVSSTVVLRVALPLQVAPYFLTQNADGSLTLPASEATVHGNTARYESGNGHDNIGFWVKPEDWVDWSFKITQPGRFELAAEIASIGSGSFTVDVDGQTLHGVAPDTHDYVKFKRLDLGTVEIRDAGKHSLSVKPVTKNWRPMNLKSITFQPVK